MIYIFLLMTLLSWDGNVKISVRLFFFRSAQLVFNKLLYVIRKRRFYVRTNCFIPPYYIRWQSSANCDNVKIYKCPYKMLWCFSKIALFRIICKFLIFQAETHEEYAFKLKFKTHQYLFKADNEYTFDRLVNIFIHICFSSLFTLNYQKHENKLPWK